jgi:hypothetical protein
MQGVFVLAYVMMPFNGSQVSLPLRVTLRHELIVEHPDAVLDVKSRWTLGKSLILVMVPWLMAALTVEAKINAASNKNNFLMAPSRHFGSNGAIRTLVTTPACSVIV